MGPGGICLETEGKLYFDFFKKNCFLQFLKLKTCSHLSSQFLFFK